MFLGGDGERTTAGGRISTGAALRHVLVFQLKLAADALRDLLLSPLSVIAFILDAVLKPAPEHSLYLRLMLLGRRSDRMINLFDEHRDTGAFTIDRAVDELESIVTGSRVTKPDISTGDASNERS